MFIPSYGMSISQICDHYGINEADLKIDSLIEKISNENTKSGIYATVKNEKVDEINQKIDDQQKKYHDSLTIKQEKKYEFKYRIKPGDTVFILKNKYNALEESFPKNSLLLSNSVITIYTKDKKIAEEMQTLYDEEEKAKEPYSYVNYTIQKGDTLPLIADKFNVTPNDILKCNEGLDLQLIYAGETISIPQYEKSKTR